MNWFERMLAELGFELWIGDPAQIKAKRVKKQKTDREDARLLLRLMQKNNFPQIWIPSPENLDLRQLLWHRHRLVQKRTRIMKQLQALAMTENKRWKSKLWSERGLAEFERLRQFAAWISISAVFAGRKWTENCPGNKRRSKIRMTDTCP
jgi:transposase